MGERFTHYMADTSQFGDLGNTVGGCRHTLDSKPPPHAFLWHFLMHKGTPPTVGVK